jgi:hypothetical protein
VVSDTVQKTATGTILAEGGGRTDYGYNTNTADPIP